MLLTYNTIINNINYVRKVFLNLKCVLNQVYYLCYMATPKYIPRLDELINSTEIFSESFKNETAVDSVRPVRYVAIVFIVIF